MFTVEEISSIEEEYQNIMSKKRNGKIFLAGSGIFAFLFLISAATTTHPVSVSALALIPVIGVIGGIIALCVFEQEYHALLETLDRAVLVSMNLKNWEFTSYTGDYVTVKSSQALDSFDDIKYFRMGKNKIKMAEHILKEKQKYRTKLQNFLKQNEFKNLSMYPAIKTKIENNLNYLNGFYVFVSYTSPAGKVHRNKNIAISMNRVMEIQNHPEMLMTKTEYSQYLRENAKEFLKNKQSENYDRINGLIDLANNNRDKLIKKEDTLELDRLVSSIFEKVIPGIKKIKTHDSDEWDVFDAFLDDIEDGMKDIVDNNNRILDYYESSDFRKIKGACQDLMKSQREFNEYIDEKVKSISDMFGKQVVRDETVVEDEYNYLRPYKKTVDAFTAEVSAAVFSSAENAPLDYIVKYFYPDKTRYPEQIQKLQFLIEELETLKEAKEIIEVQKTEVQKYLSDVPSFIMENDESGFYANLGFATINENTLTVEYKFAYTSNGGKARRTFTIPMTEELIVNLINILESKLSMTAFTKEQRSLMTAKLRKAIKERDNYTCQCCGNSTYNEPNLLLEIDHILPVARGGCTVEDNLQTLCWKCNRAKGTKI